MFVVSMNRLNQTEPATFLILSCWAFFRDSVFPYYAKTLTPSNIQSSLRRCVIYPFDPKVITDSKVAPSTSFDHSSEKKSCIQPNDAPSKQI
jgi:hypothetical protein